MLPVIQGCHEKGEISAGEGINITLDQIVQGKIDAAPKRLRSVAMGPLAVTAEARRAAEFVAKLEVPG